jgi:hypothetical protein
VALQEGCPFFFLNAIACRARIKAGNELKIDRRKYEMNNKEIALSYLKHGLSVIPLWSPAMLNRNPPKYFKE